MGEIKSALELALERTAEVKGDKSKIELHDARQAGMKLAGKFMDDPSVDLKREIKNFDRARQAGVREGCFQVLLSHLALPGQDTELDRLDKVARGLDLLISDRRTVADLMGQVAQLLQQYVDTKGRLIESLRQQFEPRMRQKEAQIAQQTGRTVKLDPSNDPEFAQALSANMDRLRSQYAEVIKQAKDQLQELFAESR
ncbi:MAG: hypothetical protein EA382_17350 [Spirochaetaceae bacterium]|nr:MAG: hypothetical protein EA382_17350 [Spirochaetaceae bacterium]